MANKQVSQIAFSYKMFLKAYQQGLLWHPCQQCSFIKQTQLPCKTANFGFNHFADFICVFASVASCIVAHRSVTFVPKVLCFRAMKWMLPVSNTHSYTNTHMHNKGSSLFTVQTSKLAAPRETSNTGEAIKRQKLFSVRSWFIWLKNETTYPTDIIFPSQGLLYQAQPKSLPGGKPLKSTETQPEESRLFYRLLSSNLLLDSLSLFVSSYLTFFSLSIHAHKCPGLSKAFAFEGSSHASVNKELKRSSVPSVCE